jgi:hypothetical protein
MTEKSSPPSSSSIPLHTLLVARFLRSNNFTQTFQTFLHEAGLPEEAVVSPTTSSEDGDGYENWTLEGIIQEKKTFDQSLRFERYGEDGADEGRQREEGWREPGELYIYIYIYFSRIYITFMSSWFLFFFFPSKCMSLGIVLYGEYSINMYCWITFL